MDATAQQTEMYILLIMAVLRVITHYNYNRAFGMAE